MSEVSNYPMAQLHHVTRRITDGSHFSPTPREYGHLIANVKDMKSGEIDFSTCTRISSAAYRELKATGCTIKDGNVLLSKDGTVGRVVVYKQSDEIGALSSICIIEPNDQLNAAFLGQALQSEGCIRQYDNFMSGSALRRLVLRDIRSIEVPLPESAHQRIIAKILDTLDTAIHETEAIIAKLKSIKQGMLHDLLTRGIDANGELRPPQTEAPHLYKESPLGWIPKVWDVLPLEEVADLQVGFAFKSDWFLDTGKTRLLRGDNVGYGSPEWTTVKYLSDEGAQRFIEYLLKDGDIVIGMDRTFTKTGSKFSLINKDDLPCLLVQRVGRFIPKLYSMDFLRQLTLWHIFQRNLLAQQKGMDIPHLSKSEILSPFVPVPTTYEQGAISEIMVYFEQRIAAESSLTAKLKAQKFGLMDDLLTGRVRVTPLLEAAE